MISQFPRFNVGNLDFVPGRNNLQGSRNNTWMCAQTALKHNTIWGQNRKYNMGPKQKIQADANAENTSGPHDVGRPSAIPDDMVDHLHFQEVPRLVCYAFAPSFIFVLLPLIGRFLLSRGVNGAVGSISL